MRKQLRLAVLLWSPAALIAVIGMLAVILRPPLLGAAAVFILVLYVSALAALGVAQTRATHASLRAQIRHLEQRATRHARALRGSVKTIEKAFGSSDAIQRVDQNIDKLAETVERFEFNSRGSHAVDTPYLSSDEVAELTRSLIQEIYSRDRLEQRIETATPPGFRGPSASSVAGIIDTLQGQTPANLLLVGCEDQAAWFNAAFEETQITTVEATAPSELLRPSLPRFYSPWYDLSRLDGTFDAAVVATTLDPYAAVPLLAPVVPGGQIYIAGSVSDNIRSAWSTMGGVVRVDVHSDWAVISIADSRNDG